MMRTPVSLITLLAVLALLTCGLRVQAVETSSAPAAPWGTVSVGQDKDGHWEALLQNNKLHVRYGWKRGDEYAEGMITDFVDQATGKNQAGSLLDSSAWRGEISAATVAYDGPERKTIHLEWDDRYTHQLDISDISIFPDLPALRVDYQNWFVNIVDIGAPGGSITYDWNSKRPDGPPQSGEGRYAIYGWEKKWYPRYDQAVYLAHDNAYGATRKNSPSAYLSDPGPLAYRGCLILTVCNPKNGQGFGRVIRVADVDCVKLLFNAGFELFPKHNGPVSVYLFSFTGGAKQGLAVGKTLADRLANSQH
jgi:hypothetical protein